jgi:hypothetical protein
MTETKLGRKGKLAERAGTVRKEESDMEKSSLRNGK